MAEPDEERHTRHEPTPRIQPGPGTTSGGDGGEYERSKHQQEQDHQHGEESAPGSGAER